MRAHERPGVSVALRAHDALGVVPHLHIPWEVYLGLIDELVFQIDDHGVQPNQIIAIAFGGIIPARAIADAFGKLNLAYFAAQSYDVVGGDGPAMRPAEHVRFDRHLLRAHPGFGDHVLVVDDLVDSGRTLRTCVDWLRSREELHGAVITTACLWKKEHSAFLPDFFVDTVAELPTNGKRGAKGRMVMPWIDQPMEHTFAVPTSDVVRRVRERREIR